MLENIKHTTNPLPEGFNNINLINLLSQEEIINKETKEILIAGVALTKVIREYAKDGLDLSDGMAFVSNK